MAKRDYYEVLGVERTVQEGDLKKTFRRLAMKYHPDRNPGDQEAEAKFKEAKEAYEVLGNANKRQAYDQYGHAGVEQGAGGGASDFGDIFGDMFGDIFGGGRSGGGQRVYRGSDLQYALEVSLEEAVFGTESTIDIPKQSTCEKCEGSGAAPDTTVETCETCGGVGQVRMQQGFFSIQQACPKCRGKGQTIKVPCDYCRGTGLTKENKKLSIKVPAGVDTGDRIRLSGEGEAGANNGPSGDLYVEIHVLPHELFTREENNLHCQVPISFSMASLGGEIEVPTLNGKVKLKIPAESQSGRLFRLRGKGVKPVRGGATGDMLCTTIVETPINLTKKQKDLMKEFSKDVEKGGDRHSPKSHSWTDNVKGFFDNLKFWDE
ncbi:MAG: molecular chaperone DnaJ [Gammaproteobacteria bacterium]